MKSVDDIAYPIIVNDSILLPLHMVKVDVLSPILNLRDDEEDLVFDLHYSLNFKRTWKHELLQKNASSILKRIKINRHAVIEQVKQRLAECDPETVVNEWLDGFQILSTMSDCSQVSWKRT